jgi:hypothetical protein
MKKDIIRGLGQKHGGAEKSEKTHFSARFIFLPSFPWASNRKVSTSRLWQRRVELSQTGALGQEAGQIHANTSQ